MGQDGLCKMGPYAAVEFRHSRDKETGTTKNWLLVALHVPDPQRGSYHMGGGFQTTSTFPYDTLTRVVREHLG
jgi:hypothetical protein